MIRSHGVPVDGRGAFDSRYIRVPILLPIITNRRWAAPEHDPGSQLHSVVFGRIRRLARCANVEPLGQVMRVSRNGL